MEDIFSTLLTLIPLSIFIVVRILGAKKKQAEAEDRKNLASMLTREAEKPAREKEKPFNPVGKPSAEEFSAHALKPDEEAPKRVPEKPKKRSYSLAAPLESYSTVAEAAARDLSAAVRVEPAAPKSGASDVSAPIAGGDFSRLDKLPPLKRAVVFAELLGTPKGL